MIDAAFTLSNIFSSSLDVIFVGLILPKSSILSSPLIVVILGLFNRARSSVCPKVRPGEALGTIAITRPLVSFAKFSDTKSNAPLVLYAPGFSLPKINSFTSPFQKSTLSPKIDSKTSLRYLFLGLPFRLSKSKNLNASVLSNTLLFSPVITALIISVEWIFLFIMPLYNKVTLPSDLTSRELISSLKAAIFSCLPTE